MKKTEKIEIRLSHEEKAGLSKLAEEEGRSVSDLVRGLIDRYMSLHKDRLPRKTRWGLLSAIGIAGILLGHLGTYFMVQLHESSHLQKNSEMYQLGIAYNESLAFFPVIPEEGKTAHLRIPNAEGDIKVKTEIKKGNNNALIMKLSICQMKETKCVDVIKENLNFDPEKFSTFSQYIEPIHTQKIDRLPKQGHIIEGTLRTFQF